VLEKEGNALAIVRPSACLGKLFMVSKRLLMDLHATYCRTYVNGLDTIAQLFFVLVRDSVGDDDLLELAAIQGFDRISTQDAMRDNGVHILCAFRYQHIGGLHKRAASISHIINQNGGFALDISD
jgi:hypothetical protein